LKKLLTGGGFDHNRVIIFMVAKGIQFVQGKLNPKYLEGFRKKIHNSSLKKHGYQISLQVTFKFRNFDVRKKQMF
jgi:hypothetical protein